MGLGPSGHVTTEEPMANTPSGQVCSLNVGSVPAALSEGMLYGPFCENKHGEKGRLHIFRLCGEPVPRYHVWVNFFYTKILQKNSFRNGTEELACVPFLDEEKGLTLFSEGVFFFFS